ncbi:hypothetical protein B600_0088 [Chlamydia psittaci VS225]|nr:hypothetical protein B600_0088 [Chlamydia psittaci VS225]
MALCAQGTLSHKKLHKKEMQQKYQSTKLTFHKNLLFIY